MVCTDRRASGFYKPVPAHRDLQVVFIGQAYGERIALVRYLRRRGFQVSAFGSGWPDGFVDFDSVIRLISRAQVVLGCGDVGFMTGVRHLKGRDIETPMCGALYLTSYNPELTDHFVISDEILCYSSRQECADLLHWITRQPEKAEAIRRAARAACLERHTWQHRFNVITSALAGSESFAPVAHREPAPATA